MPAQPRAVELHLPRRERVRYVEVDGEVTSRVGVVTRPNRKLVVELQRRAPSGALDATTGKERGDAPDPVPGVRVAPRHLLLFPRRVPRRCAAAPVAGDAPAAVGAFREHRVDEIRTEALVAHEDEGANRDEGGCRGARDCRRRRRCRHGGRSRS